MHIKANFQLDKMSVQSNLSLRTPLYCGQFVKFVHSLFCSRSSFLDELARNRLLRRLTVRLVTEMPKSYIPSLYNTDTSVKRTLGSVPLVSVLKRFDCKLYFFILWPFHLFPWASYLMTYYPGLSNICRSIINYTTINVDIKWKYAKRGVLHVFLFFARSNWLLNQWTRWSRSSLFLGDK